MRIGGFTFILILYALASSGCATLFNGGQKSLQIVSEPPGATVKIGEHKVSKAKSEEDKIVATCVTPCNIELQPEQSYPFTARLADHKTYYSEISRRPSALFWVNLSVLIYGVPGMLLDYMTGRMWVWRKHKLIKFEEGVDEEELADEAPEVPEPEPEKPQTPTAAVAKSELPNVTKTDSKPPPDSVHAKYPEDLIVRRIEWLYGFQKANQLKDLVQCTYYVLEHDPGGEELTLDRAIQLAKEKQPETCQTQK